MPAPPAAAVSSAPEAARDDDSPYCRAALLDSLHRALEGVDALAEPKGEARKSAECAGNDPPSSAQSRRTSVAGVPSASMTLGGDGRTALEAGGLAVGGEHAEEGVDNQPAGGGSGATARASAILRRNSRWGSSAVRGGATRSGASRRGSFATDRGSNEGGFSEDDEEDGAGDRESNAPVIPAHLRRPAYF